MAIIPAGERVFMVGTSTNTTYSGSAALKAMQQWYTMQDVIDTVGGEPPYKVYSALISQFGNFNINASALENTLGTVTFERTDVGRYTLLCNEFNGFATSNKVLCFITNGNAGNTVSGRFFAIPNGVVIASKNAAGEYSDDIISDCSIEVRLYN